MAEPTVIFVASGPPRPTALSVTSMVCSALVVAGVFAAYLGNDTTTLADVGSDALVLLVAPAVAAMILGLVGLTGVRWAGFMSCGLLCGAAAIAFTILAFVLWIPGIELGPGALAHIGAVAGAASLVVAVFPNSIASAAPRTATTVFAILAALASMGPAAAMLLPPEGGESIVSLVSGWPLAGVWVFALASPVAGVMFLTRRPELLVAGVGVISALMTAAIINVGDGADVRTSLGSGLLIDDVVLYSVSGLAAIGLALAAVVTLGASPAAVPVVSQMVLESSAPMPVAEATSDIPTAGRWWPDPYGRHHQRLHDGSAWTEHVSDVDGRRGVDATVLVPAPACDDLVTDVDDPDEIRAEQSGITNWWGPSADADLTDVEITIPRRTRARVDE